ncbi:MAG: protein-glutamate O-methyltransferase CheR [Algicola sp.]|nr:protein-glutamate O-methyltransferase CheR [Algicola sp.]
MDPLDKVGLEVRLLLEAIDSCYGYDFSHYAQGSLRRRILNRVSLSDLACVSAMIPKVLYEPAFFNLFLKDMSVTVTEMFRDIDVFKKIRHEVFTQLQTYSRVNIWHAGCATGEEVYSMAIMLKEEGLLKRTRIYATDFNNYALDLAQKGIYSQDKLELFSNSYLGAGGKASFFDYCHVNHGSAKMLESLKQNITFANHNLIKDQVFAEMHLIICRNVLIYFDQTLQNKVIKLFRDALVHKGFLVLGDKESLQFNSVGSEFDEYDKSCKIYRRGSYD